jgi:hypothetical protein
MMDDRQRFCQLPGSFLFKNIFHLDDSLSFSPILISFFPHICSLCLVNVFSFSSFHSTTSSPPLLGLSWMDRNSSKRPHPSLIAPDHDLCLGSGLNSASISNGLHDFEADREFPLNGDQDLRIVLSPFQAVDVSRGYVTARLARIPSLPVMGEYIIQIWCALPAPAPTVAVWR